MSNLIPFQFQQNEIRVITLDDGEVLFVASDVAKCLGYNEPHKAVSRHCKHAKSLNSLHGMLHPVDINQQLSENTKLIHESDLYRLALKSELESAESFQDWIVEEVIPSIRKTGKYESPNKPDKTQAKLISETSKAMISMAKAFGFKGNQAVLCADRATNQLTGVSPLKLLGVELVADHKQILLTPTEIGRELNISNQKVNKLLEELSYQEKIGDHWVLTSSGAQHAEVIDTAKRHTDGTPVKQIKWKACIVNVLNDNLSQEAA